MVNANNVLRKRDYLCNVYTYNIMRLRDISTETDVEKLVRAFYNSLLEDELMAPQFVGLDFEHHFPRMIGFWCFILLDKPFNTGNVFDKHRHLDIDEAHFTRWVATFSETVDSLFLGEKAEKAKFNAQLLGHTFQSKMKFLKNNQ
jgi:hemoglobin